LEGIDLAFAVPRLDFFRRPISNTLDYNSNPRIETDAFRYAHSHNSLSLARQWLYSSAYLPIAYNSLFKSQNCSPAGSVSLVVFLSCSQEEMGDMKTRRDTVGGRKWDREMVGGGRRQEKK